MASPWLPVEATVEAKVGPAVLRLMPYRTYQIAVDDRASLPWAWIGMVDVTFRFGTRMRTKRIKQRYAWRDQLGWPLEQRPSEAALANGRQCVIDNLLMVVREHGVMVDALDVVEATDE